MPETYKEEAPRIPMYYAMSTSKYLRAIYETSVNLPFDTA